MRVVAESFALTLGGGIPYALYDATWAVSGRDGLEYRDAFERAYHLENGTLDIAGDLVPAKVAVDGFDVWWLSIALWLLDPLAACLDGCPQSQRPSI